MNNGQMIVVMKIQPSICLDDWGKHEKTPVRLVGAGIRNRDLPNASLVRYQWSHLGRYFVLIVYWKAQERKTKQKNW